jgi:hypothetical protein
MARKPLAEPTVAANVLRYGTGSLNIDGCRIATDWDTDPTRRGWQGRKAPDNGMWGNGNVRADHSQPNNLGRWPPNVALDEEAARLLDEMSGERPGCKSPSLAKPASIYRPSQGNYQVQGPIYPDTGGASRFMYCAKASRAERNAGLDGRNDHPTVKPLALCDWLVRLVTPPGGTVLDPFTGSGSIGCSAVRQGFSFIGMEQHAPYVEIAEQRIRYWQQQVDKPQKQKRPRSAPVATKPEDAPLLPRAVPLPLEFSA